MSDEPAGAGPDQARPPSGRPADAADDEEGGAVAAARAWVGLVMDERDIDAAWPLTDPPFRKVLAQHWILSAPPDVVGAPEQWETLADRLAERRPNHPLWRRFSSERVTRWREFWPGFSAVTWGVKDHAETRPGIVVVTFVEPRGKLMQLRPGPPLEFRRLALRRTDEGWLLAGVDGSNIFRPGWPPTPG